MYEVMPWMQIVFKIGFSETDIHKCILKLHRLCDYGTITLVNDTKQQQQKQQKPGYMKPLRGVNNRHTRLY